ncbi:hypothetical protein KY290_036425 [Solanum tuberosum]|uniref:Uncharacterized protein n=1 Tax=Solanum tuberosum TaxID=4113 RepID=A0ABQ7TWD1_SOLTU|nr:hypothetical protein KY289_035945 [Solanum tuberosum]KAH0639144.1 hypothetical protein KY285_035730 [Solanum tuberosum]KAH0737720.1 hypothetical protein KY290_036425 [Solanum tuberosum]
MPPPTPPEGFSNLPEENAEDIGSSQEDIPHFGDEESRVPYIAQYDKAIDARYDKIREKEYKTKYSKAILKTLYPMEDEAAKACACCIYKETNLLTSNMLSVESVDKIRHQRKSS